MNQNDHRQEFVRLINEHKAIIFKICNSYCRSTDDRDDLAQEIIYNLWKSFERFNPEYKFTTWMYRVSLNVAISYYKKELRSRPDFQGLDDILLIDKESELQGVEEHKMQQLFDFIHDLRELDKSIILLYLEEKSYREIAEITGITESNVSTRINRIKDKLKSNFQNNKNQKSWNSMN